MLKGIDPLLSGDLLKILDDIEFKLMQCFSLFLPLRTRFEILNVLKILDDIQFKLI